MKRSNKDEKLYSGRSWKKSDFSFGSLNFGSSAVDVLDVEIKIQAMTFFFGCHNFASEFW